MLPDTDGKVLIQFAWETFQQVSPLMVWAQLVGMVLVALLMLSAILFAPIWGLRMLLGKLQNAGPLAVRVLPLLSAVLLAAFDGLFAIGLRGLITADRIDDLFILGVPSWLTVSILFVSIAFPLTAVVSLYVVYRARRRHESHGVLAFGSGRFGHGGRRRLSWILGTDWAASLGVTLYANRKICLQPSAFPRGLRKRAPFFFRRLVREGLLPRRSR